MPYADPETHRSYHRKYMRAYRASHPYTPLTERQKGAMSVASRKASLRHLYGITVDDYGRMCAEQKARCKSCGSPETGWKRSVWCVDHNHVTGKVRGLVCHDCNVAIGRAKDSPAKLRAMARYLEENDG